MLNFTFLHSSQICTLLPHPPSTPATGKQLGKRKKKSSRIKPNLKKKSSTVSLWAKDLQIFQSKVEREQGLGQSSDNFPIVFRKSLILKAATAQSDNPSGFALIAWHFYPAAAAPSRKLLQSLVSPPHP